MSTFTAAIYKMNTTSYAQFLEDIFESDNLARDCPDDADYFEADDAPTAGLVYNGALFIERMPTGAWCLTIGSEQDFDCHPYPFRLLRKLYDFGVAEGWIDSDEPQGN